MSVETTRLRALCATIPEGDAVPCCGRAGTEGHRSSWSLGLDGLGARVVARMDGPVQLLVAAREGIPALCDELEARDRELARLQGLVDARRTTEEAVTEKARREADDLRAIIETRNAEDAMLLAQLAPLVRDVDALRAAARASGWADADATGETLVAWVRRGALRDAARIAEAAADAEVGVIARALREVERAIGVLAGEVSHG